MCENTHRNNIIETEQVVFIYLGVYVPVCMFVTIKKKKPWIWRKVCGMHGGRVGEKRRNSVIIISKNKKILYLGLKKIEVLLRRGARELFTLSSFHHRTSTCLLRKPHLRHQLRNTVGYNLLRNLLACEVDLPSLQNCKNRVSVLYNCFNLRYAFITAQTD